MAMRVDVIAGGRARMTHFLSDADPNERFQDTIHRGPGNLWRSFPGVAKDLIGGRMIRTDGQGFQNHPALDGEGEPVLAADLRKLFDLGADMI